MGQAARHLRRGVGALVCLAVVIAMAAGPVGGAGAPAPRRPETLRARRARTRLHHDRGRSPDHQPGRLRQRRHAARRREPHDGDPGSRQLHVDVAEEALQDQARQRRGPPGHRAPRRVGAARQLRRPHRAPHLPRDGPRVVDRARLDTPHQVRRRRAQRRPPRSLPADRPGRAGRRTSGPAGRQLPPRGQPRFRRQGDRGFWSEHGIPVSYKDPDELKKSERQARPDARSTASRRRCTARTSPTPSSATGSTSTSTASSTGTSWRSCSTTRTRTSSPASTSRGRPAATSRWARCGTST